MSSKRRNIIAFILILVAAVCWTFGRQILDHPAQEGTTETTAPGEYWEATQETMHPTTEVTMPTRDGYANTTPSTAVTIPIDGGYANSVPTMGESYTEYEEPDNRSARLFGFILCFVGIISAGIAVFAISQKKPIVGPDGVCLLLALLVAMRQISYNAEYIMWSYEATGLMIASKLVAAFVILISIRELYGWIRAKFSLSWCLAHRTAKRCVRSQLALLSFVGWIVLPLAVCIYYFTTSAFYYGNNWTAAILYLLVFAFGVCCLWKYGSDLTHFKQQLDNYQHGKPITVGEGAFSQTEAQLLQVQAQHEEAVRTAVTSERFKVELISNVSHDLRTPLTAILGYSELLQKEALSADGQEQLHLLQQKAGYMSDLVESLFELTKVSSGVIESKKEEIDLIRLLEQTIGLFDDQLTHAGLFVRRNYASDSVMVVTDGARMHQVFANLLGNAIKYAMAGTRIYLEVKETENSFLVRMMNTASYEMDFKPEEIMQRFARGDKARSTKGSGLGLAIAQTYTESVGGSFRVGVDGDQFSAIVELPKIERNL